MSQIQKESEDQIIWYTSVMTKQKIVQIVFYGVWLI